MTKWIGKASLTMQSPRRIMLRPRFHIDRASLCSPFYEGVGRIDEDFDPGRRQAHVGRARLLILTRHSFVQKEGRAIEVKPSNTGRQGAWTDCVSLTAIWDDQPAVPVTCRDSAGLRATRRPLFS